MRLVDGPCRLSESRLWELQRTYYATRGLAAWSQRDVPFHATNNSVLAGAFARVVVGFLRDCAAAGALDPSQPVYVIEVGAGPGQFSHLFLTALDRAVAAVHALEGLRVVVVITDFAEKTVESWAQQPDLAAHRAAGRLQFGTFDLERDDCIRVSDGTVLGADTPIPNPTCVIANYVFDTTCHDAFFVVDGRVSEARVSLYAEDGMEDLGSDAVARLKTEFVVRPLNGTYYRDSALDGVLADYSQVFAAGRATVLVPVGAVRGIRSLQSLCTGRMLLLVADKGMVDESEFGDQPPGYEIHAGAFSVGVNFDALARWFRRRGGVARLSSLKTGALKFGMFASDAAEDLLSESVESFAVEVDRCSPSDYFGLIRALRRHEEQPKLDILLPLLRLSDGDAQLVAALGQAIVAAFSGANRLERADLRLLVAQATDHAYRLDAATGAVLDRVRAAVGLPDRSLRTGIAKE